MVSNPIKMEGPAYGSAFEEESGNSWSQVQVNQRFHVQEHRFLFGIGV
jgi:hypothetical protein